MTLSNVGHHNNLGTGSWRGSAGHVQILGIKTNSASSIFLSSDFHVEELILRVVIYTN